MELVIIADDTLVWPARIRPQFGGEPEVKNLSLAFFHGQDKKNLHITVNDVWEDDLYTEDLVPFLLQQGVIDGEWAIVKTDDTDGRTYIEEIYTTFILERR